MIVDTGAIALLTALIISIYSSFASLLGGAWKINELVTSGKYGLFTIPPLLGIATGALIYAFITHDFSVKYVANNSSLDMPDIYTWVAIYAGNSGSLLFIAFVLSILIVILILNTSKKLPVSSPYINFIVSIQLIFLLLVMVALDNPLDSLPVTPEDGKGINPLLIHFGMFIHPPTQMTGLVAISIPFSIAMGTLIANRGQFDDWIDIGRTWGIISWIILTFGLILGSWWAYTILGWGGYWAWDPVENSALMPWLIMTAFIHSIMVQKNRRMFRTWNMILIILAISLSQMGMFINRGGPVPSVHSFAQSTMGWLFLIFMAFTLLSSITVLFFKSNTIKSKNTIESIYSRETIFLVQNILFIVIAAITLWGTIYPVISDLFFGQIVTVGEPFYDKMNGPLMLLLIAIMGIAPLFPWKKGSNIKIAKNLITPAIIGLLPMAIMLAIGFSKIITLFGVWIFGIAATIIIRELINGTISINKKYQSKYKTSIKSFFSLLLSNRPRYGGYIVHLAVLLFAAGVIHSTYYAIQKDIPLSIGDTAQVGKYSFLYVDFRTNELENRSETTAIFNVSKDSQYIGSLESNRTFFYKFKIAATRAGIRSVPIEDFYIVPSTFSKNGDAVFRVYINPMVWIMWASGPLLFIGAILSIWPRKQNRRKKS